MHEIRPKHNSTQQQQQQHASTSEVTTSDSKMAASMQVGGDFSSGSPELGQVDTDTESGGGSPKNLPSACLASGFRWESAAMMPQQPQVRALPSPPPPQIIFPRQPQSVSTMPQMTSTSDTKASPLSNELLKIFANLGLDTGSILELLASQGKLHICRSCNIVFPEYSTFVLHRGCHGTVGPFQCHFCQVRFPEKFGFLTHFMQCPHK